MFDNTASGAAVPNALTLAVLIDAALGGVVGLALGALALTILGAQFAKGVFR